MNISVLRGTLDRPVVTTRLVLFAILLGAGLRIEQYLNRGTLWLDESMLAISIVARSPRALIFSPLEYNQLAPPAFLQASKLSTMLFGNTDLALRLPALLLSLAALVAFAILARMILTRGEAFFAIMLFALSWPLLTYAAELKQYSGDVFAAAFIPLVIFKLRQSHYSRRWLIATALTALSIVWVSDASMVVLAGSGCGFLVLLRRERDSKGLRMAAMISPFVLLAGIAGLLGGLRRMAGGTAGIMKTGWHAGFMPTPWSSLDKSWWIYKQFTGIYLVDVGVRVWWTIPTAVGLYGVVRLWRDKRQDIVLIVLTPVLSGIVLSIAGLYPFLASRITLYLAPAFIVALTAGVFGLANLWPKGALPLKALALLALPSIPAFVVTGATPPGRREDVRQLLAYFATHRRPGDKLYVYWAAEPSIRLYGGKSGLSASDRIVGSLKGGESAAYFPELDSLRTFPRVWVLFAHTLKAQPVQGMIDHLNEIGHFREKHSYPGNVASDGKLYLYTFDQRME